MGGPPSTPNGYDRKIPKGRRQDTTTITDKPMQIISNTHYIEANKSPDGCGKHHGSIKPHGIFL